MLTNGFDITKLPNFYSAAKNALKNMPPDSRKLVIVAVGSAVFGAVASTNWHDFKYGKTNNNDFIKNMTKIISTDKKETIIEAKQVSKVLQKDGSYTKTVTSTTMKTNETLPLYTESSPNSNDQK